MTESELHTAISAATGMGSGASRMVLAAMKEEIIEALQRGETIRLTGFGEFSPRTLGPTRGISNLTGTAFAHEERRRVHFRALRQLKEAVR